MRSQPLRRLKVGIPEDAEIEGKYEGYKTIRFSLQYGSTERHLQVPGHKKFYGHIVVSGVPRRGKDSFDTPDFATVFFLEYDDNASFAKAARKIARDPARLAQLLDIENIDLWDDDNCVKGMVDDWRAFLDIEKIGEAA
jgi:hypothetical protein